MENNASTFIPALFFMFVWTDIVPILILAIKVAQYVRFVQDAERKISQINGMSKNNRIFALSIHFNRIAYDIEQIKDIR